jgi:electron transfer flavoprotein beta subunit
VGKQAIDDDYVQTGQILASILGWPSATFSSKVELGKGTATITREVDFGLQKISVPLPAVLTVDLRLNTPRFANVQNILKAKKKPVDVINLADLGVDVTPRLKVERVEAPTERKGGIIVETVDELVAKLRNEAKVI